MLTYGNVTSTGIIYASGGLISSASSSFGSNVNVSGVLNASGTVYLGGNLLTGTGTGNSLDIGALNNAFRDVYASSSINVGNGANSSTFKGNYLALTNGTSSTVFNGSSLTLGQGTNYNSGMFNVNSNGNVNASGTIQLAKLGTSSAGVTTYNSPDINIQSSAWDTDGSEDTWQFKIRNAPSSAATTVGNLKFLVQKNANSEAMVFSADSAGAFTAVTSLNTNTGIVQSNNTLMIVKGWAADGGTSVGVALDAGTAFVNAGAKLVSIRNAGTEKAYFNASGTPAFGIQTGYNDGLFKIDTSGNVSATGSLKTFGNVTSTGNLYALTSTASTSILNGSSLTLGQGTAYNSGMFNVDSNGNVRTSGTTFQMYDPNSGQLSANFSIITSVGGPPGQNYASTTFNSLVYDSVGSTGFVFNTYVGGEGGAMTSGTTPGVPDTAAPAKALAVFQNNGTNKVIISAGGNVYAKNSFIANSTTYSIADMAEYVNLTTGETGEPGDVLVVDLAHPNQYKKSSSAYSKEIAGVISDTGAFLMGASGEGRAPLALAGLVKTKVTDENGPIAVGDYLVSASKPGYAMKYDSSSGKSAGLVGMALEPLANGDGKITIMVNMTVGENGDGTLSGGEDWDVGGKNILNVKSISGANGLWYIDEKGFLMAKEIKADKVQAKKFVVEKETNLKKASVGEATISQNNSSITVENELITSKVKIFITFRSNPQSFWWISKQEDGKFEVSLSKVAEVDLTFDYWIVGVEDAPALETKSAPAASVAPIETPVVPVVESAPITPIVPDTASASTTVETPAPVAPVELAPTESASVSDEVPNP
ncbi:MAG: hypothetical protein HZC05_01310 [Candidatus Magasanikbacteria bacterium]|nr:hypothetical protein [Candidatus Magasanikbacteria bacterium]